ncbi:MAG: hypothetical protein IKJ57_02240 [Oscillospiraceae bacterium]|nr:hypothetical protein [Oscillospiraceae bacterium]
MKKSAVFIMILAIALMFSGCAPEYPEIDVPETNTPEVTEPLENTEIPESTENLPWERNATEHWKTGKNGEKLEVGEHKRGKDRICPDCQSQVYNNSDGSADVIDYNEHGHIVRATFYNPDGTVKNEALYEHEYDEYGNLLFEKAYPNPEYVKDESESFHTESYTHEFEYAKDSNGNFYVAKDTLTYAIGEYFVTEYTENNQIISKYYYNTDGKLYREIQSEWLTDENGVSYIAKSTTIDHDYHNVFICVMLPTGETEYFEEINEAGESVIKETYDYDDKNRMVHSVTYHFGIMTAECFYEYESDESATPFQSKKIVYNEDGTKVVSVFDEKEDKLLDETHYDAKGNKKG